MNRGREVERAQEGAGKQYVPKDSPVVNSFVKHIPEE